MLSAEHRGAALFTAIAAILQRRRISDSSPKPPAPRRAPLRGGGQLPGERAARTGGAACNQ